MGDLSSISEGDEHLGRKVVHVNALKPYCREEKNVLFTMKAADKGEHELPFWEGRGQPKFNPEEVQISPALSIKQQSDLKTLVNKYQQVFSSKPGVAQGVLHRIVTGNAPPHAVTPYRVTHDSVLPHRENNVENVSVRQSAEVEKGIHSEALKRDASRDGQVEERKLPVLSPNEMMKPRARKRAGFTMIHPSDDTLGSTEWPMTAR